MRLSLSPRLRTCLFGILSVLAAPSTMWAVSNGPLGTPIAQFKREVVNMVRDPIRPVIYATTTANSVIAINTGTMVMKELLIGSNPVGLDVSADGSRLYVANSGSTAAGIGVVNLATFTALASLPAPFEVTSVAAGLNGRLYVLGGSAIDQINGATGAVEATAPSSVSVYSGTLRCSPDRKTLYYSDFGLSPSTLYALEVAGSTPTLAQKAGDVGSNGEDLVITADGGALVYPNGAQGNYQIYLIPTRNLDAVVGTFNIGAYPAAGAFSPDGKTFYASQYGLANEIQAWSVSTFTKIGSFVVSEFGPLLVDRTGKYLFVSGQASNPDDTGNLTVYATGAGAYPEITSPASWTFDARALVKFPLVSNGSEVTWSATGLPAGLSLDSKTGILSGAVSSVQTCTAAITATESGGGSTRQALAIAVQGVPASVPSLGTRVAQFARSIVEMVRDPDRPFIYATTADNTVIALDTRSLQIAAEFWIGSNPAGLAISPDGTRLYVANSGSSSAGIGVLDLTTFTTLPSLAAPFPVTSVAAGLNERLYVLGSELLQIDGSTGRVEATILTSQDVYSGKLVLSPDKKTLIYGDFGLSPGTLYAIDVSGSAPVLAQESAFGTVGENGEDLVMKDDGSAFVYATGGGQSNYGIALIPTNNVNSTLGTFNVGAYPRNGAFSPDGSSFYTAPDSQNAVQIWSTASYLQANSFSTPALDQLLVDQSGRYLFTTTDSTTTTPALIVYSTGRRVLPTIASPATLTVDEGASVRFDLRSKASGVTWSTSKLPGTLALNSKTGMITGSVATPGKYAVQVAAMDPTGGVAKGTLIISVVLK